MEFWMGAIVIVWTFVGLMFLATGVLSIWWQLTNFNWFKYLNGMDKKDEEQAMSLSSFAVKTYYIMKE